MTFVSHDRIPPAGETGSTIYIRDRRSGTTTRVPRPDGIHIQHGPHQPEITGDGRVVLYLADVGLPFGCTPPDDLCEDVVSQIFSYDRRSSSSKRIGPNSNSGRVSNGQVDQFSVSPDGRYVVFQSTASDIIQWDNNEKQDVFLLDLHPGSTYLISVSSSGAQGNKASRSGTVSADGRLVAFASDAFNLVPRDTNRASDVFLRNRETGTTSRASVS